MIMAVGRRAACQVFFPSFPQTELQKTVQPFLLPAMLGPATVADAIFSGRKAVSLPAFYGRKNISNLSVASSLNGMSPLWNLRSKSSSFCDKVLQYSEDEAGRCFVAEFAIIVVFVGLFPRSGRKAVILKFFWIIVKVVEYVRECPTGVLEMEE